MSDSVIVGVDVGGTFTDLFWLDAASGRFRTAKVPSRRGDEAVGFANGLAALGGPAASGGIVHGTTVGTNTLLERRGPKIGVIATRGFRDTLEMRRRDRRRHDSPAARSGRNPRRCKTAAGEWRAGGRRHLHQRLRQPGERASRAR